MTKQLDVELLGETLSKILSRKYDANVKITYKLKSEYDLKQ